MSHSDCSDLSKWISSRLWTRLVWIWQLFHSSLYLSHQFRTFNYSSFRTCHFAPVRIRTSFMLRRLRESRSLERTQLLWLYVRIMWTRNQIRSGTGAGLYKCDRLRIVETRPVCLFIQNFHFYAYIRRSDKQANIQKTTKRCLLYDTKIDSFLKISIPIFIVCLPLHTFSNFHSYLMCDTIQSISELTFHSSVHLYSVVCMRCVCNKFNDAK